MGAGCASPGSARCMYKYSNEVANSGFDFGGGLGGGSWTLSTGVEVENH